MATCKTNIDCPPPGSSDAPSSVGLPGVGFTCQNGKCVQQSDECYYNPSSDGCFCSGPNDCRSNTLCVDESVDGNVAVNNCVKVKDGVQANYCTCDGGIGETSCAGNDLNCPSGDVCCALYDMCLNPNSCHE